MIQENDLLEYVFTERDIMVNSNHPFIMKLSYSF